MKALGILGSPRPRGVSAQLLDAMLGVFRDAGWETPVFPAGDERLRACSACQKCHLTGRCIDPRELEDLYADLLTADAVVIATPVYFFSLPSGLKRVIDRCQPFWVRRYKLKDSAFLARPKIPCVVVQVAGGPRSPRQFTSGEIVLEVFCNTLGFAYTPVLSVTDSDRMDEERLASLQEEARGRMRGILASARG